jgi:hypothetical protein
MPICKKCQNPFPNTITSDGKTIYLHKRKYCLTCSPFGLHNTRIPGQSEKQKCKMCGCILTCKNSYQRKKRNGFHSYCKPCHAKQHKERIRKFKKLCVNYKGGKCEICNYDRYIGALDFHHSNGQKEFQISKCHATQLTERIRKELDKCRLLCCRCHREEHELSDGDVSI